MFDFMTIIKALADENRVRILMSLKERELCVCQVTELLGLAPSTVSKHLAILKQARLLEYRKNGRWIYYRLADKGKSEMADEALAWVQKALANDKQLKDDEDRLEAILKVDAEQLCRKY